MTDVDVLIIGGGPTGLGAAWQCSRHPNVEWLLCEQNPVLGGLSRSIVDVAGYTWDIGGHVCFSHFDAFTSALSDSLSPDGYLSHHREAWVWVAETLVPYPFQNNLRWLPANVRDRCLAGLAQVAARTGSCPPTLPRDFEEFIVDTFGAGIAETFMRPYNEKVWAYPLGQMSYDWIGERVAVPDPCRVAGLATSQSDDVDWGPNNTFIFPKRGGTGMIWSSIGDSLPSDRVVCSARAMSIDRSRKVVEFSNGIDVSYRNLIASAPLDHTALLVGDTDLAEQASALQHSSVYAVGLGVSREVGERLGTLCWTYFPDPDIPFYRLTNFSHYSPHHVPDGVDGASLLIEVSESSHRPVNPDTLVEDVVNGLIKAAIIDDSGQVTHSWVHREEYAYPTPTLGRDHIVDRMLAALEADGILSRGRFGAWRYEVGNMDHSFAQGYEAAARALTGCGELTVWNPAIVNQRHPTLGWGRIR